MATTTPRIGLTKPDGTDLVDIAVLNTNFDKIDSNIASTKIQSTKPTTANAGDLWWDSDTGTLYLYYTDANSSQWVAATSDPINIGVVANQTERDAQYPTPAQGMSVYRTDLGVTQRYYGLFNGSTNPGGRDTAGWYDTEKSIGLVPVQPTTVTIASGTGSANSLGVVSFTNATKVTLQNIFSARYENYFINFVGVNSSTQPLYVRLVNSAGSEESFTAYTFQMLQAAGTTINGVRAVNTTQFEFGYFYATELSSVQGVVTKPFNASFVTKFNSDIDSGSGSQNTYQKKTGGYGGNASYTGLAFYPGLGTMTGTVQVFGYNEK